MFLPSLYGFSVYDAYMNTMGNNDLFKGEQREFLKKTYQSPDFIMPESR
jgi:hypothetical protein